MTRTAPHRTSDGAGGPVTQGLRALLDPRTHAEHSRGLPARVRRAWRVTLDRLLPLGGGSEGNQLTVFFEGDEAFEAMLSAIRSARQRVWLETYIFEPDRAGQAFLGALLDARRRGVHVVLLYDVVGSPRLSDDIRRPLVDAGADVIGFNPPWRLTRPLPMLLRDHRKILVVDDGTAFCGGMNIGEDYAGPRYGNCRFRDTHALIEGPAAAHLAALVAASVQATTGRRLPARSGSSMPLAGGVFVQVLASDILRRRRHIQRALYHTVGRCLRTCFLTTPYLVPPARLVSALARAARRGVDVRILTAGVSDVPIVALAARHLYSHLLQHGVKIYEMTGRTLHAKTAAIDGVYASIGSFNLDRWSFGRNLEVSVTVMDPGLAARMEEQFMADLRLSHEVEPDQHAARGPFQRLVGWLAFQLMRL